MRLVGNSVNVLQQFHPYKGGMLNNNKKSRVYNAVASYIFSCGDVSNKVYSFSRRTKCCYRCAFRTPIRFLTLGPLMCLGGANERERTR